MDDTLEDLKLAHAALHVTVEVLRFHRDFFLTGPTSELWTIRRTRVGPDFETALPAWLATPLINDRWMRVCLAVADLPLVLLNERGDVQSRCTLRDFCLTNPGLTDCQTLTAALTANGEWRVNMGCGGLFVIRSGKETDYQAAVAVCVTNHTGSSLKSEARNKTWELFAQICSECENYNHSPKIAAGIWAIEQMQHKGLEVVS